MRISGDVLAIKDKKRRSIIVLASGEGTWMSSSARVERNVASNVTSLPNGIIVAYSGDDRLGQLFMYESGLEKIKSEDGLSKKMLADIIIPKFLGLVQKEEGVEYCRDKRAGKGGRATNFIVSSKSELFLIKQDLNVISVDNFCAIGSNDGSSLLLLEHFCNEGVNSRVAIFRVYEILSKHILSYSSRPICNETAGSLKR